MSTPGSVTNWIDQLHQGDPVAAHELWRRYFPQLAALARRWLAGLPRGAGDEEDVALSAFANFCQGVRQGDHSPDDRDELWRLLAKLTARRAVDRRRRETARKRGGGAVAAGPDLDALAGREPPPDAAAVVAEEMGRLLGLLGDAQLQSVALFKLEGQTNEEIAARLGCVPRTVERRLRVIRSLWAGEVGDGRP